MHFVGVTTPGGPSNLSVMVTPVPLPKDGEVLIKVHAAGVNGADLREREGRYPVPAGAPDIMGLEVAGEIIATGKYCSRFKPGDLVCALLIGWRLCRICNCSRRPVHDNSRWCLGR